MTFNFLKNVYYKTAFQLRKHSPGLLTGIGIISVVGGTVAACVATSKLEKVMEPHRKELEELHANASNMDDKSYRSAIFGAYGRTTWDLTKLYGPSAAIELVGIGCILKSDSIMRNRNAALAAAYTTVTTAFDAYKNRVAEKIGDEAEKEIRYGIHDVEISEEYTNKKGETKIRKKKYKVLDENVHSPWARFYADGCDGWSKDPGANNLTLKAKQGELNERLRLRGYLFLNEAYELLGIQPIREGQYLGWYYDPSDPTLQNKVDFGLTNCHDIQICNFVNGFEDTVIIDFNIDGNIVDRFHVNNSEMARDYYGR